MNWKWPSRPDNSYAPWYAIAWRLIWWLPIALTVFVLSVLVLACMLDTEAFKQVWRDNLIL